MSFFNRFRKQTSETQGERIEPGRAELDAFDEPKEPVLGQPSGEGMNPRPNAPEAGADAISGAAPSVSGAFTAPTTSPSPGAANPFNIPSMPSAPTTGTADAASVNPWQTFSTPVAPSTGAAPFPSTAAPTAGSASGSTFAGTGFGAACGAAGTSNTAGTNTASAGFAASVASPTPAAPAAAPVPPVSPVAPAAPASPAFESFRAAPSAADAAQSRGFTAAASGAKSADVEAQTPITKPVPRDKAVAPKRTKMVQVEVPSDEELAARRRTRHRLVGAAALLMAVVVAAPFVLDSESSYDELPMQTEIPPVPTESAPLDVPDVVPSTAPAETAPVAPPAKVEAKPEAPAKPAAKPEKPEAKPDAKAPAQGAKDDAKAEAEAEKKPVRSVGITPPTGKGYYVQIVATSSELEAEKYVKRLALLGLPAYRVPVERPGATLWRVRVGLFKDAREAEGAKGTIVLNGIAPKPMVGQQ